MNYEGLTEVGLTPNEAKIYLTLLGLRAAKVKTISEKTGLHRRNVYDALEKLLEKGLVTRAVGQGTMRFEATNPEHLLSYMKEKETKIKEWLPELTHRFEAEQNRDEATIYRGIGGIKAILQDMLKTREDLYLIGSKLRWKTIPELKFFTPQFEKNRVKLGIRIKQIFDHEVKHNKLNRFELGEAKFFPKDYSTPIHIWIYGNRVVSLFYGAEPTAFMIKSQKIADGYKKYFNFMWKHLAKGKQSK